MRYLPILLFLITIPQGESPFGSRDGWKCTVNRYRTST
jgi:hypothetical protein